MASPITISPGAAAAWRRAAWFVASPIAAKLRWSAVPTLPTTAAPVLTPTRKRGQSGCCAESVALGSLQRERRAGCANRVIGLLSGCVEHDHDGVAREPLDQPVLTPEHLRHDEPPVLVEHRDHRRGRRVLGERREALEIGKQHADFSLLAAQAGSHGVDCELARELRRHIRPEQPVDAVDLARGALEHEPLLAAETQALAQFVGVRVGRAAQGTRSHQLIQRRGVIRIHASERVLEVEVRKWAERRRGPAVLRLHGPRDDEHGERDEQVPFPPGHNQVGATAMAISASASSIQAAAIANNRREGRRSSTRA